ncbi:transposase [Streptomyces sp. TE5632]
MRAGIEASMGSVGDSFDNALAENPWMLVKTECIRGRIFATQAEANLALFEDLDGLHQLLELLSTHGDTANSPVPVAIETSRGLLVACLRATGRPVYAINPTAAARYRDRYTVTRKKSDHLDAMVLANILRTDKAAHRPLPDDSELAQAIAILARAQ